MECSNTQSANIVYTRSPFNRGLDHHARSHRPPGVYMRLSHKLDPTLDFDSARLIASVFCATCGCAHVIITVLYIYNSADADVERAYIYISSYSVVYVAHACIYFPGRGLLSAEPVEPTAKFFCTGDKNARPALVESCVPLYMISNV